VLELTRYIEPARAQTEDIFAHERRYELRYPQTAQYLPAFMQGYNHNIESALAILLFLEQHFEVNPAMSAAIRALCVRRE
jgi:lincosamide nucleotidyltransferase